MTTSNTVAARSVDVVLVRLDAVRGVADPARAASVRSAAGRDALVALLARRLVVSPSDVVVVRDPCTACGRPHGKPRVAGAGLEFSLAHADDRLAVAVAPRGVPVGVDLEHARAGAALVGSEDVFVADDRPATAGPDGVLRIWLAKEAVLKCTGEGLNRDPRDVRVDAEAGEARVDGERFSLEYFDAGDGYVGAVATRAFTAVDVRVG